VKSSNKPDMPAISCFLDINDEKHSEIDECQKAAPAFDCGYCGDVQTMV
jgi:hypothetical protein